MVNDPLNAEILAESHPREIAEENATDDGMPEIKEREQRDVAVLRIQVPTQWIRHVTKLVGTDRGFMRRSMAVTK